MSVRHVRASDMPTDRSAIEGDSFTATVGRFDARPRGWHHHGDQHVVGFVISGTIRIESGPGGSVIVEPSVGDLVHIEPRTVHRETYEDRIEIVGFTAGSGPGRIDVDGPDPS